MVISSHVFDNPSGNSDDEQVTGPSTVDVL